MLEAVAPHAHAAARLEAVEVGQLRQRQGKGLAVGDDFEFVDGGIRVSRLCPQVELQAIAEQVAAAGPEVGLRELDVGAECLVGMKNPRDFVVAERGEMPALNVDEFEFRAQ